MKYIICYSLVLISLVMSGCEKEELPEFKGVRIQVNRDIDVSDSHFVYITGSSSGGTLTTIKPEEGAVHCAIKVKDTVTKLNSGTSTLVLENAIFAGASGTAGFGIGKCYLRLVQIDYTVSDIENITCEYKAGSMIAPQSECVDKSELLRTDTGKNLIDYLHKSILLPYITLSRTL